MKKQILIGMVALAGIIFTACGLALPELPPMNGGCSTDLDCPEKIKCLQGACIFTGRIKGEFYSPDYSPDGGVEKSPETELPDSEKVSDAGPDQGPDLQPDQLMGDEKPDSGPDESPDQQPDQQPDQSPDLQPEKPSCSQPSRACYPSSADPKKIGVGVCKSGTQTCQNGVWSKCQGAVTPTPEACGPNGQGNGKDDNCDGQVDEGCMTLPPGVVWQRQLPAGVSKVALASFSGSLALCVQYAGQVKVGATTVTSAGGIDLAFVNINPTTGVFNRVVSYGSTGDDLLGNCRAGASGDLLLAGTVGFTTLNLGGGKSVSSSLGTDAFAARLNPANFVASQASHLSSSGGGIGMDVLEKNGKVYLAGRTDKAGKVGIKNIPAKKMFLVEWDNKGQIKADVVHADQGSSAFLSQTLTHLLFGFDLPASGNKIAMIQEYSGAQKASGFYRDQTTSGFFSRISAIHSDAKMVLIAGSLTSNPFEAFVSKYDSARKMIWTKRYKPSIGSLAVKSMAVGGAGKIYLLGELNGSLQVGGSTLTAPVKEAVLLRLDSAGKLDYGRLLGPGNVGNLHLLASGELFAATTAKVMKLKRIP